MFPASSVLSPFLFPLQSKGLKSKGNGGKRSRRGRRARFIRSDEPEQSSDNHYGEAVRKGLGTSPLLRCPKNADARRRSLAFFDRGHSPVAAASAPGGAAAGSPPPPPVRGMSREDQTLPSRDLLEYEIERCIALSPTSSQFRYRRAFAIAKKTQSRRISRL